jgi:hypothetical protein
VAPVRVAVVEHCSLAAPVHALDDAHAPTGDPDGLLTLDVMQVSRTAAEIRAQLLQLQWLAADGQRSRGFR